MNDKDVGGYKSAITIYEISGANHEYMRFCSTEVPAFLEYRSFVNDAKDIFTVNRGSKSLEWILPPQVMFKSNPINKKKLNSKNKNNWHWACRNWELSIETN
ncbi:MAG: hypothetical protein ACI94Z_002476 [Yoonia sp.]